MTEVGKPSKDARRFKFTKSVLEQLVCPPNRRQVRFADSKTIGLSFRVTPSGKKSFVYYRKFSGWSKPFEHTIGSFPDLAIEQARNRATELNARFASGETPEQLSKTQDRDLTYDDIFKMYLEQYAKLHTKTWSETLANHRRYFENFSKKKAAEIKKSEVQSWVNDLAKEREIHTANRNYDTLRAVFTWASKKDICALENPCMGVDRFRTKSRERFIQPGDEFERFAEALMEESNEMIRDFFWLLLYTGARKSNVLEMRWDQINFQTEVWRIPDTKNGESLTLPLTSAALNILLQRHYQKTGPWVFPSDGATGHLVSPKKVWGRLLKRAGIENLRIHDLRRTAGSYMAIQGVSPAIIGKALGHRSLQATAIYARLNQDPVRLAMQNAQQAMPNLFRSDAKKV